MTLITQYRNHAPPNLSPFADDPAIPKDPNRPARPESRRDFSSDNAMLERRIRLAADSRHLEYEKNWRILTIAIARGHGSRREHGPNIISTRSSHRAHAGSSQ